MTKILYLGFSGLEAVTDELPSGGLTLRDKEFAPSRNQQHPEELSGMGIPFGHLRHRYHRLLLRGTREADRRTFHAPSTISTDPDTVAEAARIIVPYIADAYDKSSRSTAAGLAKALEVLKTLENAGQNK